jgi:hypothetical protein
VLHYVALRALHLEKVRRSLVNHVIAYSYFNYKLGSLPLILL